MKYVLSAVVAVMMLLVLTSCGGGTPSGGSTTEAMLSTTGTTRYILADDGDTEMLDKLYQIQLDWTMEQTRELLGEPDVSFGSGFISDIYHLSDTESGHILYGGVVWEVFITNSETGDRIRISAAN